jgi:energy-coupling factor transporter ATP-binding protein EcfA2
LIGSTAKKVISGGERKRTSIGVELITDPSVILLDEPTSGLDSFKALQVVKLLNRIARKEGKTVIATLHQPSSQAFNLFDRLIFMMDGNIAFQGYACQLAPYFLKLGQPCPTFQNPSDFYMKKLSVSYPLSKDDMERSSYFDKEYKATLLDDVLEQSKLENFIPFNLQEFKAAPQFTQFKELVIRANRGTMRDPQASKARVG